MKQPTNLTSPNIGLVIVSYNSASLIGNCLQSLRYCTLPLQTIVVDNHSSDNSVALVQQNFPEVLLLAQNQNLGFAAANNVGIRTLLTGEATLHPSQHPPEYILLLNPDTIVHPYAIEKLCTFLQAHPRVGMVAPRLLNPDGSIQSAAFRFPTLSMSLMDVFPPGTLLPGRLYNSWWHGRYPEEQSGNDDPYPIDHPLGACMLVRSAVIEEVGVFDEDYFMYSEEIEWCWRIHAGGWAIWQIPQAHVTHIGGASTRQFRHRMFVALHRSRVQFFRQHYSQTFLSLHRAITRAGMVQAVMETWYEKLCRHIDRDELRARLWAYGEVHRL